MKRVGVTGGIGSGKTLVCKVFNILGIPVYNADHSARMLVDKEILLQNELKAFFGDGIFTDKGLNRPLFSSMIFHQKQKLDAANRIIHPWVRKDFEQWAALHQDKAYVVEEAAILFESGGYKMMDKCITVVSPIELRIKRLLKRPGLTPERIEEILNNQWTDKERIRYSDFILINDEKIPLLPQILHVHRQIITHSLSQNETD
jgi:dephospho-CoA kinase